VVFQGALLLGGLVAFFFLLIELSGVMNPLLLATAATVLVWPMREHPMARSLLLAGGLVLLWWLLMVTGEVLLPFAVVYLLAYLLDPPVSAAYRRWNIPRWASSLALTLVAVGALVAVFVFLVPNVVVRVEELVAGLLESLSHAQEWIMESTLVAYLDEADLIAREELEARLTSVLPEQIGGLVAQIPVALEALTRSVSAIIALIVTVTLIPVLLFYTLRDFPTIERNLIGLFPKVDGSRDYLQQVGHIVGSYLRGQLAISLIAAFNVGVLLAIFGVPFPLLIGLLAGALNLIPNVGVIITNVLGVGIAFIFGTPVDALVVVLVLFGQQILEATILSPNIMSHQVGLHPVLVILSLLLFGATMGFFGLLIAVPLTALLVTFYKTYREEMTLNLSEYANGGSRLIVSPEAEAEANVEEETAS
jgi:predicted PurR-regulated permease PerM